MSELTGIGLCATCVHVRRVASDRQAVFYLCEHSKRDPSFPRYPAIPVLACRGHEPRADELEASSDDN